MILFSENKYPNGNLLLPAGQYTLVCRVGDSERGIQEKEINLSDTTEIDVSKFEMQKGYVLFNNQWDTVWKSDIIAEPTFKIENAEDIINVRVDIDLVAHAVIVPEECENIPAEILEDLIAQGPTHISFMHETPDDPKLIDTISNCGIIVNFESPSMLLFDRFLGFGPVDEIIDEKERRRLIVKADNKTFVLKRVRY